ncbi:MULTISPECIES: LCI fold-containing protein [Bacillus]|uniref:LCI fold-containing protein n=1 Tax=Bacillus TaxID=1386 RepID=UPI0008FDBF8D|nr:MULTISPECIES: LCI fold-containing protein [Bacillus cereus group]PAW37964.1 hypothetical protein CKQ70_30075 [Bacillus toyonensis]HDR7545817.1 hypothetical protein [Bacillus thuringiensis]MDA2197227.1 LCI family antimicrobial peptide [Bacillus cereus group sp. Bc238]MDA2202969.1 LCI family antimicrobial peptide [Bacillus cereus group sp. Bc237]OJD97871.1 hypothetical protein A9487_25660 [Bacillus cereus]
MFKKLVVGALATGIALTGGIGAASASTENVDNTKNFAKIESVQKLGSEIKKSAKYGFTYVYEPQSGKYITTNFHSPTGKFANYFEDEGIKWYFKGHSGNYGHYEGRK